ncbi:MAG: SRPBCC family protein [Cytophagaceae bacterium]
MPTIELTTCIFAPIEKCFDVARNIDLHKESMGHSGEEAIAGVTSGLIGFGEEVTWRAKHLGFTMTLSSRITAYQFPVHFRDEMIKGPFKMICHDHIFRAKGNATIMEDKFCYESPLGVLGNIFNRLYLNNYLKRLLLQRNRAIKIYAEKLQDG